ncbi:hypothetical protein [Hymenobacter sp. UYP22]|uniref:hypothetical protein n=1 Tax=Hymenobacter sp. UYP22 TaxID=3156348 RepID=UPI0033975D3A
MSVPIVATSAPSAIHTRRATLWVVGTILMFGLLIFGLYQQARQRLHGLARPALVVHNRRERSAHLLTLRYVYGPDTLLAQYTENHRNRVKQLRPGDSTTVRFWPEAPRNVQVVPR